MSATDPIDELLLRWEDLRQQGLNPTAEELCPHDPGLQRELRERIAKLERLDRLLYAPRSVPEEALNQFVQSIVSDYEILQPLGHGAMGLVFKARQLSLKRTVALKLIPLVACTRADQLARFRQEAEALARLQHPNVVQVYDLGESGGWPYIAFEYVEGGNLKDKLGGMPQPPREAAQLVATLAQAVHYAHQRGVLHRDLKPANILLTARGVPKISDFGLAKQLDAEHHHTDTGQLLGTPSYMAPEQAEGRRRDIGPALDVYALGAILYELLTGRPPFKGTTKLETLELVRTEEPVPPRQLQPRLPRDLETICLKCLRKEAGKRYASAAALGQDLERFLAGEPIQARPVRLAEKLIKWVRRRPAKAALIVAGLLLAGMLIGAYVWQKHTEAHTRAETLVTNLAAVETARVPALLEELGPWRTALLPLLHQMASQAAPDSKERLHASLALLPDDANQVTYLIGRIGTASPEELLVLRSALEKHREEVAAQLWGSFDGDPQDTTRAVRFRAACVLAGYDPENPRWNQVAPAVARHLVSENPLLIGHWAQALRPVRAALLPPLTNLFRESSFPETDRFLAATLLADYAADQPERLADLLLDASPRQFGVLLERLRGPGVRERVSQVFHTELERVPVAPPNAKPLNPNWPFPSQSVVQQLEQAHGLLADGWAFCQTLPYEEFDGLAQQLTRSGYRPMRFRPYQESGRVLVAAVWERDGKGWRLTQGTEAEVRSQEEGLRRLGHQPLDAAGYLVREDRTPVAGAQENTRYAVLWGEQAPEQQHRLQLGRTPTEIDQLCREWKREKWDLWSLHYLPHQGSFLCSGVWIKNCGTLYASPPVPEPDYEKLCLGYEQSDVQVVRRTTLFTDANDPRKDMRTEFLAWLSPALTVSGRTIPWTALALRCRQPATEQLDRCYAAVWRTDPAGAFARVQGQTPQAHLVECQRLVRLGYWPIAASVAWIGPEQGLRAASIWQARGYPEEAKDALAQRQANAAVALLQLGEPQALWPLLRQRVRRCEASVSARTS